MQKANMCLLFTGTTPTRPLSPHSTPHAAILTPLLPTHSNARPLTPSQTATSNSPSLRTVSMTRYVLSVLSVVSVSKQPTRHLLTRLLMMFPVGCVCLDHKLCVSWCCYCSVLSHVNCNLSSVITITPQHQGHDNTVSIARGLKCVVILCTQQQRTAVLPDHYLTPSPDSLYSECSSPGQKALQQQKHAARSAAAAAAAAMNPNTAAQQQVTVHNVCGSMSVSQCLLLPQVIHAE